jgi:integrase
MTHEEVDGVRVGQHELVSRFMKGIFNSNPPTPRYSATWDVDVVLKYLSSLPENVELQLAALTHKLAMLFALCSANRCSELAALDLDFCSVLTNEIRFVIPGLTKTRRKGSPKEVIFSAFSESPRLCPVSTFLEYRQRTSSLRSKQQSRLFIAVRKPHRPVTSATIGHWLKKTLKLSGIDTSIFTAHSTRGAATSKASTAGISIPDILKTADWSSATTFRRFYHRPISSSAFGQAVLSGRQSSSSKVSYERYHVVN